MRKAHVCVEGPTAAEFLRRLMPLEISQGVEFVGSSDDSGMVSLARSLLVRRRKPVAVFMNSDSLEPTLIQERRKSTEELVHAAAANVPAKVIVVIPEIEVVFFSAPRALEKLFGEKVPDELLVLGRRDPVGVLQLLARRVKRTWSMQQALQSLDAADMDPMRSAPPVMELSQFLQGLEQRNGHGGKK